MEQAAGHPWMLYVALVIAIIVAVAGAVPKVLGPLGAAVDDWAKRQRAAAASSDDADIAERDRQIAYLQGRNDEQQAEIQRRDALIRDHLIWDYDMYDAAVQRGARPPHPPPLHPAQQET